MRILHAGAKTNLISNLDFQQKFQVEKGGVLKTLSILR